MDQGAQNLDRHGPIEARVACFVNLTHPAGADLGGHFIRAEATARTERHCFGGTPQLYGDGGGIIRVTNAEVATNGSIGPPYPWGRRLRRAAESQSEGSPPQLGRQRARCERGPEITAAPYPFEAVGPFALTEGSSIRSINKTGCGSGPIARCPSGQKQRT